MSIPHRCWLHTPLQWDDIKCLSNQRWFSAWSYILNCGAYILLSICHFQIFEHRDVCTEKEEIKSGRQAGKGTELSNLLWCVAKNPWVLKQASNIECFGRNKIISDSGFAFSGPQNVQKPLRDFLSIIVLAWHLTEVCGRWLQSAESASAARGSSKHWAENETISGHWEASWGLTTERCEAETTHYHSRPQAHVSRVIGWGRHFYPQQLA